jgi:glycosyltransferase involved in cell wall biosynthesis
MTKSTKKLSFILPCYNVEKYIAECLDSLYNQDIPETDYEVICVNDCSPDGTRGIIVEYQQQHNNLILINHEKNTRQGGARNTGLRAAQGEYIWFIDPDDYIVPNCLEKMLKTIENNQLDILFFNLDKINEDGTFLEHNVFDFSNQVCEGKTIFENNDWWNSTVACWARVMRRSVFFAHNIFFYDSFYHEDVIFGVKCFLYANRILLIPDSLYVYRMYPSETRSADLWAKSAAQTKIAVEYCKILADFNEKKLQSLFVQVIRHYTNNLFKSILYLSYSARSKFYAKLKLIDDLYILYDFCDKRTRIALKNKWLMNTLHAVVMPLKKLIIALRRCKIIK